MGARGPKPGFKARRAAEAAARAAQGQASQPVPAPARVVRRPKEAAQPSLCERVEDLAALPAAHRENPEKLAGAALRHLAHRRGISRSEADRLSDVKLREQLRYLAYQQYEAA